MTQQFPSTRKPSPSSRRVKNAKRRDAGDSRVRFYSSAVNSHTALANEKAALAGEVAKAQVAAKAKAKAKAEADPIGTLMGALKSISPLHIVGIDPAVAAVELAALDGLKAQKLGQKAYELKTALETGMAKTFQLREARRAVKAQSLGGKTLEEWAVTLEGMSAEEKALIPSVAQWAVATARNWVELSENIKELQKAIGVVQKAEKSFWASEDGQWLRAYRKPQVAAPKPEPKVEAKAQPKLEPETNKAQELKAKRSAAAQKGWATRRAKAEAKPAPEPIVVAQEAIHEEVAQATAEENRADPKPRKKGRKARKSNRRQAQKRADEINSALAGAGMSPVGGGQWQ